MGTRVLILLLCLEAFLNTIQGSERQHIQTQEDRNKAMKMFKEDLATTAQECNKRHYSDTKLTWMMLQSKANYRPGKCFLHCMMMKYDMVDKSGEMKPSVIRDTVEKIPGEKSRSLFAKNVDKCIETANGYKKDKCEQAYQLSQCFYTRVYNQ